MTEPYADRVQESAVVRDADNNAPVPGRLGREFVLQPEHGLDGEVVRRLVLRAFGYFKNAQDILLCSEIQKFLYCSVLRKPGRTIMHKYA